MPLWIWSWSSYLIFTLLQRLLVMVILSLLSCHHFMALSELSLLWRAFLQSLLFESWDRQGSPFVLSPCTFFHSSLFSVCSIRRHECNWLHELDLNGSIKISCRSWNNRLRRNLSFVLDDILVNPYRDADVCCIPKNTNSFYFPMHHCFITWTGTDAKFSLGHG